MYATCLTFALLLGQTPAEVTPLLPFNNDTGLSRTFAGKDATVTVLTGDGQGPDGNGSLQVAGKSVDQDGSYYLGIMVPLPQPVDLRERRLRLVARTNHPGATGALYVRGYNTGENKAALSWNSWGAPLRAEWASFDLQPGLSRSGLSWEPGVVEDRVPSKIDRLEIIIGTREKQAELDVVLDSLGTMAPVASLATLAAPRKLVPETPLVVDGKPNATVLHPDTDAGRAQAARLVDAVRQRTGATLAARAGTAADAVFEQPVVLLGGLSNNPAFLVLYARRLTPSDEVCPGPGGALLHTVHDPFGNGANAVVAGASDDAGLAKATDLLLAQLGTLPAGRSLVLGRVFERAYSEEFLKRFSYAGTTYDEASAAKRLKDGLALGQRALDEGAHTSIAGVLQGVAVRYQLNGQSAEAQLFVQLWEMYAKSAVADPRKFGGPWGFDSDFPSWQVVTGWDTIEEDPSLTDADRLAVSRSMARWLQEAVVPKCAGAVGGRNPLFNHQTFPALGTLMAGFYYGEGMQTAEGQDWLAMADKLFQRQQGYTKVHEDCNGYQWLTNGHLFTYCVARPSLDYLRGPNAKSIIDFLLISMDNLTWQVPYGDTGSWKCWNSEIICLDIYGYVTGDPAANWAASSKRRERNLWSPYEFMRDVAGEQPAKYNGVRTYAVEPAWYHGFKGAEAPALERTIDKISFRGGLDPQAPYLLLDGLSAGGHKHLDGNSLPRLTQYNRIWLADNDYYKTQVKYHNSLLVFRDGQATPIPEFVELLGAGESQRFGYSRTRLNNYCDVDWDRAVVWLKDLDGFVVLDKVTARANDEFQLRSLWHGVGEPEVGVDGLLLKQDGPSLWIQPAPGPKVTVTDDPELGGNWSGYPHAEPIVRSLSASTTVRLAAGETYLFATALHGSPDGVAKPWRLSYLDMADGVLLTTDRGAVAVALGPLNVAVPQVSFFTDSQVMVLDKEGLTLLGVTEASVDAMGIHASAKPECVDIAAGEAEAALAMLPLRQPRLPETSAAEAPAQAVMWQVKPQPERLVLTGNKRLPGAVSVPATLVSEPLPGGPNVFSADAPNAPEQLLDGDMANNTGTSVMYLPDQTITLTLDLGREATIDEVAWQQWWSTSSSKNTKYLLRQATISLSNDNFMADKRVIGTVTDDGPHPNFGSPIPYAVDAKGARARYVRYVIAPQPGSAVYLSELLVYGRLPEGDPGVQPYTINQVSPASLSGPGGEEWLIATGEGDLLALQPDGQPLWTHPFGCELNDVTAADLDGDGRDEVIVARQDHFVTVLNADGSERWSRELLFYRRPPYVNLVRTGDIDGDGQPEVIAGGENWRFYAYDGDGTELWNYESVHPSRSGAVADLDGDGQAEVLCGTHYYYFTALKPDGTKAWAAHLGPICYDVAVGNFDADQTRGVAVGGGDGILYTFGSDGKPRLKYNTGDEVRQVECADLDGDGHDEVLAGSLNYSLYCFGADGQRRWRQDLGEALVRLATVGRTAVAGTASGAVLSFDGQGKLTGRRELGSATRALAPQGQVVLVATADGQLTCLKP